MLWSHIPSWSMASSPSLMFQTTKYRERTDRKH